MPHSPSPQDDGVDRGAHDPAADRALAGIEAFADAWIAETDIHKAIAAAGACAVGPFKKRLSSTIYGLVSQAYIEAFYAGFNYHKDGAALRSGTGEAVREAEAFARRVHAGQTDNAGLPYTGHLGRVAARARAHADAMGMSSEDTERCEAVGWLHDTIEDTDTAWSDLEATGFDTATILTVDMVSKNGMAWSGERTPAYLEWIAWLCQRGSTVAKIVKLADLEDNTDSNRPGTKHLTDSHRARYEKAKASLRTTLSLDPDGRKDQGRDPSDTGSCLRPDPSVPVLTDGDPARGGSNV